MTEKKIRMIILSLQALLDFTDVILASKRCIGLRYVCTVRNYEVCLYLHDYSSTCSVSGYL